MSTCRQSWTFLQPEQLLWLYRNGLAIHWNHITIYEWHLCMILPEVTLFTVCEQPALSVMVRGCINQKLPCTLQLLESPKHHWGSGSSISLTPLTAHVMQTFNFHKIFKCDYLKLMVSGWNQANKHPHTHVQCSPTVCNWLRLASKTLISMLINVDV